MIEGADDTLAARPDDADRRDDTPSRPRGSHVLERGDRVGRYMVLERLGAGGMGVVYAAYDPELDRKVAIKLLFDDLEARRDPSRARTRLLGEAKALARLNHPEIVGIHDVGVRDTTVWIAMELVEGVTLGTWAEQRDRSWREIVDVMIAVARGVAAAQAAGLVHGDLKPDNLMVVANGGVRVMDFGLTRPRETPEIDARTTETGCETSLAVDGLRGTPAYMAPEQFAGLPSTVASDQFSFCVTLWELLFRRRPFSGQSLAELAAAVLDGELERPGRRHGVPGWLRRACERGLARDPEARWPSMDALRDELGRGRLRGRRRVVAAVLAGFGGAALLVPTLAHVDRLRRVAACEADGEELHATWNDERRAALRQAFAGSGLAHADESAERVLPWLDDYARELQYARTGACLDATVDDRDGWDGRSLERARWCLDDRRMGLASLIDELTAGDRRIVDNAVRAAARLTDIEACRDLAVLSRLPEPPVGERGAIETIREKLSRSVAMESTGHYTEGLAVSREAQALADALDWPPLAVAASLRVGVLLERTGDFAQAERIDEEVYFAALRAGALEVAADAASNLVLTVGIREAHHEEGVRWSRHLEALLYTIPDPTELRSAGRLTQLGTLRLEMGAYDEAAALLEEGIAIQERVLGGEHPNVAVALGNLANVRFSQADYERARALQERALAISEQAFGPWNPAVSMASSNLANVYYATGEYEEAQRLYGRALAIDEDVLGPTHPEVAADLGNLATAYYATRDLAESRALNLRALAIDEKALGPDHPSIAVTLNNLGNIATLRGELDDAEALHQRALAIRERALGPEHASVGNSANNLGDVARERGRLAEAEAYYRRALAIHEHALGPEHPKVATALVGLARVAIADHRAAEATPLAERAVALRERGDAGPAAVADARLVLAQSLCDRPGLELLGIATAVRAREEARTAGRGGDEARQACDLLLRQTAAAERCTGR